jgi:hypothetical protein
MGNLFKPKPPAPPKADPAIEEARIAEEKRKAQLEAENKSYTQKVARGVIGSRSLFGKPGGRGFF